MEKNKQIKKLFTFKTYDVVLMGLLCAIYIVLDRFLVITNETLRFGFAYIALAVAGMALGPVKAAIVAGVSDFIGCVFFSPFPFNPMLTITYVCVAIMFGILLYSKQSIYRCVIAALIHQLFFSLIVNSYWLALMYGSTYFAIFSSRIFQTAVMLPIELVTLCVVCNRKVLSIIKTASVAK